MTGDELPTRSIVRRSGYPWHEFLSPDPSGRMRNKPPPKMTHSFVPLWRRSVAGVGFEFCNSILVTFALFFAWGFSYGSITRLERNSENLGGDFLGPAPQPSSHCHGIAIEPVPSRGVSTFNRSPNNYFYSSSHYLSFIAFVNPQSILPNGEIPFP